MLGSTPVFAAGSGTDEPKDAVWVNQVFQRGKAYYESGNYPAASREWDALDPYLDQYPSFKKVIGYLQSQISGSPAVPVTAKSKPVGTSQDAVLDAQEVFSQAEAKLQKDLQTVTEERSKLKTSSAEQESWIRATLHKGQVAYENDDWNGAFEEWKKIEPFLDPTSPETVQLIKLHKSYEMVQLGKKQNEEISRRKKAELKIPAEFTALMKEAQQKLEKEVVEIQTRQEGIEKDVVFEEAWIDATFNKGKIAYEAGNMDLAIEEWDKLAFKLKNSPELAAEIERLKAARRNFRESELHYTGAANEAGNVNPGRNEMQRFFKQAAADIQAKADTLSKEGGEKQQSVMEQQKRVTDVFEKGKALYLQGKHKEALDEWLLLSSYFEGDPVTRAAFLSAQGSLHAYDMATTTYQNAVDTGVYKNRLPDGFFRYLEDASRELAAKARETEDEKQKAEQAIAAKRTSLILAFEQGKKNYAQGMISEAVSEWKKITPWIENGGAFEAELQKLEVNGQEAKRQVLALKEAREKAVNSYSAPGEFAAMLKSANEDVKNQALSATNERLTVQQQMNETQVRASNILYKAGLAYKAGKIDQAVEEWGKMKPYLDPASEETILIDTLKQNLAEYNEEAVLGHEVASRINVKMRLPDDLKKALTQANEDLVKKTGQMRAQYEAGNMKLSEQVAFTTTALEKGKLQYQAGRLNEALSEFEKLVPYLDSAASDKVLIENLGQNYAEYVKASGSLRQVAGNKEVRTRLPEDLTQLLVGTNQKLIQDTDRAIADHETLKKQSEEKQVFVRSAQDRGRLYYDSDRIDQALAEWEKLFPFLDPLSGDKLLIENLKQNYLGYREARDQLKAASAEAAKIKLPDELHKAVSQTSQELMQRTNRLRAERESTEGQMNDRSTVIRSAIEKGRIFQQTNRIDQALAEWEKLLPYLSAESRERALIENLRQNYKDYLDTAVLHQETFSKKESIVEFPPDLKKDLAKTNEELIQKATLLRAKRQGRETKLAQRRAAILSAVEKGKILYQTQHLDQALVEWDKLLPYLDNASEEKIQLENLRQSYRDFQQSFDRLKEVVARSAEKVVLADDLKKILSETTQGLIAKANELRGERQALELKVEDRQTQVLSTLEKARVYTQAGRVDQALEEWNKITNAFDESSDAKALVQGLETSYAQYVAAKAALAEALSKRDAKMPAPEDMAKLIQSAQKQIASNMQDVGVSRAKMEKEVLDRQAFVDTTFEKGKNYASNSQWLDAVYEWEKLLPYLDEKESFGPMIEDVKKNWNELEAVRKSNDVFIATTYKETKLPFAPEMEKVLIDLDGALKDLINKAQAERSKMEKALGDRETFLKMTFEKGKAYYEAGKYKEAIEFWTSLMPQLKEDPQVQSLASALPQRYQDLVDAQKAAADAQAHRDEPLPVPLEFSKYLDNLAQKINAVNLEAMSRAEKAKQTHAERAASVGQIFSQGQAFYEKGEWENAIKTWSALPPYLQEEERVRALVDNLAASYRNYVKAQEEAKNAEATLEARFAPQAELSQILMDAAFKLDKERQVTELARERTEKIIAEKQTAVQQLYAEGKAYYDQGKLPDAFAAWRSLLPSVNNQKELEDLLNKADQSFQGYVTLKEQNQQSLTKKEIKLAAPTELNQMLETVNLQLRDQVFDLKNRISQTEKMLQDRKSWIEVTFQKGKLAYTQGRYQEAVAEWRTLMPFVENGTLLEKQLADFEQSLKVSLEASKIGAEAENKKSAKFVPPDELGVLLVELNEKVKNEALQASAEKIRSEQQYSERRKWMKQRFDLGKSFYLEGKFDQAIAEWEKFGPYLDEQSGAKKLLEAVKQSYEEASLAKKSAVEAAAGDYQGLKLPYAEQMEKLLSEADTKLKEEASAYTVKKGEMEKTMAERQEWSVTTFNKGKIFYDQGQYDEALGQWERLLPYLEEGQAIKERIISLRESVNAIAAGKNSLGESSSGERPVKLKNEEEVLMVLEQADQKFKAEAEALRAKKLDLEKSFEQRAAWMEDTFQKGKTYYDQGNYSKAVEEWGTLGPYLGENPRVRDLIEAAKKDHSEGRYARHIIETMEAKKAALTEVPAQAQAKEPTLSSPGQTQEIFPETTVPADPVQLVSGEIVSIDVDGRTLTLKLFTENGTNETLTVNFDERTQVDGAGAKSLSADKNGSSIDVRYNPQTSRALYIYVY